MLNAFDPSLSNGAMMDIGVYTVYPMVAFSGGREFVDAQGVVLSSGADGQGSRQFPLRGDGTPRCSTPRSPIPHLPSEIEGRRARCYWTRSTTYAV